MRCYVLNLDRSPERWTRFNESFSRSGLDVVRVPAVDGQTIDLSDPKISHWKSRLFHGARVNGYLVGCSLSHFKAMERFLETDDEHAMICEDDVSAKPELGSVLDAAFAYRRSWDILRLNNLWRCYRTVACADLGGGYRLCRFFGWYPGLGAYLVNRRAAERFLRHAYPVFLPSDHYIYRAPLFGLKTATIDPLPIQLNETSGATTILYTRRYKYPGYVRWWTTLPYRGFFETLILARQLGEIVFSKIAPPRPEK